MDQAGQIQAAVRRKVACLPCAGADVMVLPQGQQSGMVSDTAGRGKARGDRKHWDRRDHHLQPRAAWVPFVVPAMVMGQCL